MAIAVGRQLWRHFFVDFLQRWIGVAGVEIGERALGAIERAAGALERDHGVLERRLLGIVCDDVNLLALVAHPGFHRRDKMLRPDLVERRQVIRQRALFEQWVIDWIGSGHGVICAALSNAQSDEAMVNVA